VILLGAQFLTITYSTKISHIDVSSVAVIRGFIFQQWHALDYHPHDRNLPLRCDETSNFFRAHFCFVFGAFS
jgi:hypothetical protein